MCDRTTGHNYQLEGQWIVIGRDDGQRVGAWRQLEVIVVTLEVIDDPGIGAIDIHLCAPWLHVQLHAAAKLGVDSQRHHHRRRYKRHNWPQSDDTRTAAVRRGDSHRVAVRCRSAAWNESAVASGRGAMPQLLTGSR